MNRLMLRSLLLFLFSASCLFGQADIWYLGNNIKMDFGGGGVPTVSTGIEIGTSLTENGTSISNPDGSLGFAVVGDNLYDGGQVSVLTLPSKTWDVAQGTIVFPVPGETDKYFLSVMTYGASTTSPTAIYYEITVNGSGAGNISYTGPNNLLSNLTEAQAGVPKVNPDFSVSDDYWLVTHERCNNNFKVFSVESSGINLNSTQAVGTSLDCITTTPSKIDAIGVMKFNNCYTQMVYCIGGRVQRYDFDAQTGQLTFVNEITTLTQPYGVEFSSDGSYVYVLTGQDNNNPGVIYSMQNTAAGLAAPVTLGATNSQRGGHLQLAPDGNIYYAIPVAPDGTKGTGRIGVITDINNGGVLNNNFYQAAVEDNNTPEIEGQWMGMDMPTFLKSLVSSIATLKVNGNDLNKTQVCQGESVTFSIEIEGSLTPGVTWTASGSNSGSQTGGSSFTMTMANTGVTTIEVDVVDDCGRSRTLDFDVEVFAIENATATLSSTCPRTATGVGSSSGEYKWYDADPASGGSLIGTGATFDAAAYENQTIWVEPSGAETSYDDPRGKGANNITSKVANITLDQELSITEFKFAAYTNWPNFGGTAYTVTLAQGGSTVGTPIAGTYTCSGNGCPDDVVTAQPTDWSTLR